MKWLRLGLFKQPSSFHQFAQLKRGQVTPANRSTTGIVFANVLSMVDFNPIFPEDRSNAARAAFAFTATSDVATMGFLSFYPLNLNRKFAA